MVVDYYRVNAKTTIVELNDEIINEDAEIYPQKSTQRKFDQKDLAACIRKLPDIQQQIIILKFVNGLGNEEIAEITGKSVGALRVIQHRALAKMKELLEAQGKEFSNENAALAFKTMPDA